MQLTSGRTGHCRKGFAVKSFKNSRMLLFCKNGIQSQNRIFRQNGTGGIGCRFGVLLRAPAEKCGFTVIGLRRGCRCHRRFTRLKPHDGRCAVILAIKHRRAIGNPENGIQPRKCDPTVLLPETDIGIFPIGCTHINRRVLRNVGNRLGAIGKIRPHRNRTGPLQ